MIHAKIRLVGFMAASVLAPGMVFAMKISSNSVSRGILDSYSACEDHGGDDEACRSVFRISQPESCWKLTMKMSNIAVCAQVMAGMLSGSAYLH